MEYGTDILVCGHRGDRVWGRENTMGAFRMAVEAGVDMVETDVRMTADGALILMHDAAVDRTTDATGLVRELTLAQIRKLNAAVHGPCASEPPALLEELLVLLGAEFLFLSRKASLHVIPKALCRDVEGFSRDTDIDLSLNADRNRRDHLAQLGKRLDLFLRIFDIVF